MTTLFTVGLASGAHAQAGGPTAAPTAVTVKVLGISAPDSGGIWWDASGRKLPGNPAPSVSLPSTPFAPKGDQVRTLVVEVRGAAPGSGSTLELPGSVGLACGMDLAPGGVMLYGVQAQLPDTLRTCSLHMGISSGAWSDVARRDGISEDGVFSDGSFLDEGGGRTKPFLVVFSAASRFGGKLGLTVSNSATDWEARIVALDTLGKAIPAITFGGVAGGEFQSRSVVWPDLTAHDIRAVVFQARPYQWVDVKDIALFPKS